MSMSSYQEQSMLGATGIELVIALYDGAIRSLYRAKQAVREGDVPARRVAVKKVVDIFTYLQARLRPDVGGSAAQALSDFYAAMFTLTLEASHVADESGFDRVIDYVCNVREAWSVVARDPEAGRVLPRELRTREERFVAAGAVVDHDSVVASRWSA